MSFIKSDKQFIEIGNNFVQGKEEIVDKTDVFVSYLMFLVFTSSLSIMYYIISYILYDIIYMRLLTYGHKINQIMKNNNNKGVNHSRKRE